jgi:hydrogenase nickel incorporation protein HypA/HybF
MHELSIALSLIEVALEQAQKHGNAKVEVVHLKLGAMSGVDKEALAFSYTVAIDGTALQGSKLMIEDVPVTINCPTCHAERVLPSLQQFSCPECHTPALDIVRGREIEISALEIAA